MKKFIALLALAAFIVSLPLAASAGVNEKFKIYGYTDKASYLPGEDVTVYVVAENQLNRNMLIKSTFFYGVGYIFGKDDLYRWNGELVGSLGPYSDGNWTFNGLLTRKEDDGTPDGTLTVKVPGHSTSVISYTRFRQINTNPGYLNPGKYIIYLKLDRIVSGDGKVEINDYELHIPVEIK